MKNSILVGIALLLSATQLNCQTPKIEYIAHAAFVLESSQGTRIVIDPYHSYRQMGFTFPKNIMADAVLITHPHYDHDGSQYFSKNTPVHRDAGTYQLDDIHFYGIASKHSFAEQIGKSGNQNYNTIWVVEIDGIKIAHLGDNEVPTASEVLQLADVDYVIGHPRDADLELFKDKVYIPNHYLLPEVTAHKNWMQPVSGWLEDKEGVQQLTSHKYTPTRSKSLTKILVFKPSPLVKEWPAEYYDALASIKAGFKEYKSSQNLEVSVSHINKAIEYAPYVMDGYYSKAQLLHQAEKHIEVIAVLEKGFSTVADIDWGTEAKARVMLAKAYVATQKESLAYIQYTWLNRHKDIVNKNDVKEAQVYIENYEDK
jgi:L-ascorbate metabolism protein UlaG (beta-lactamase superfamily)